MAALTDKTTWLLLLGVVCSFLGTAHAFPAYSEDKDFQELKEFLEQARRGIVDGYDSDYLPDLYDFARKGTAGYAKGYFVDEADLQGQLKLVRRWPRTPLNVGQVGGLAVEENGDVSVFHRGSRKWEEDSFNADNTFKGKALPPIHEPTVTVLEPESGSVRNYWGQDMFYLPHGITVDTKGNVWVTDVAMHQVFKFAPGKFDKPALVLGKAFEPAKNDEDTQRFCKPTDVVVAFDGSVFVADGYCRSRIMKYDPNGTLIGKFGDDEFDVPHSLALAEDLDLICVADRENLRIMCFNAGLKDAREFGTPDREYTDYNLGRVYSIGYSPKDGFLYGVGWQEDHTGTGLGFTIDLQEDSRYKTDILSYWKTGKQGFFEPHVLAVSPDGKSVYVGEIHDEDDRKRVWKFEKVEVGTGNSPQQGFEFVDDDEDDEDDEDEEDEVEEGKEGEEHEEHEDEVDHEDEVEPDMEENDVDLEGNKHMEA